MPPKRFDRRIIEAIDANTPIISRPTSSVARLGTITLTNSQCILNERGQRYQELARERGRDSTILDPWQRGTTTRGQSEYAIQSSGRQKIVGRWRNGTLQPTRLGEQYYGLYEEEHMLHVPYCVLMNYTER